MPATAPATDEGKDESNVEQVNSDVGEAAAKDAAAVPVETIEEDAEDKQEQEEVRGRGKSRKGRDS